MWRFIRRWNPAGEDEKNDAAIDERRDYILEPRTALDQEQAKAGDGEHMDDDEVAVQARLEDYEAQLIEDKPLAEAENNDSEALLAVDAKALGTTSQHLATLTSRHRMSLSYRATLYLMYSG